MPAIIAASSPQSQRAISTAAAPFSGIEHQGCGGEIAPAGAQHVGRADIARADLADVAEPGGAGDQQAERDRAEQSSRA